MPRFLLLVLVGLTISPVAAPAQEPPEFATDAAKTARAVYLKEVDRIEEARAAETATAMQVYKEDLTTALDAATKAGQLDEAIAIRNEVTRIDKVAEQSTKKSKGIVGKWKIYLSDDVNMRIYTIDAEDNVLWTKSNAMNRSDRGMLVPYAENDKLIQNLEPGVAERVHVYNDRLYIERWNLKKTKPHEFPTKMGIGIRER